MDGFYFGCFLFWIKCSRSTFCKQACDCIRLIAFFCGIFLSSFSPCRILSRLGIAQASLALLSLLQNLGHIARYAPSNANKNHSHKTKNQSDIINRTTLKRSERCSVAHVLITD